MAKKNKETTSQVANEAKETTRTPNPDAIAARAFQYYVQEGRIEGRDLEYWLRAERDLNQEFQKPADKAKNGSR